MPTNIVGNTVRQQRCTHGVLARETELTEYEREGEEERENGDKPGERVQEKHLEQGKP